MGRAAQADRTERDARGGSAEPGDHRRDGPVSRHSDGGHDERLTLAPVVAAAVAAFKSNRQKGASKRQGKWPDQTLDQAFGLPEVLVAVSTSRLSSKRAGKHEHYSSGESRITSF